MNGNIYRESSVTTMVLMDDEELDDLEEDGLLLKQQKPRQGWQHYEGLWHTSAATCRGRGRGSRGRCSHGPKGLQQQQQQVGLVEVMAGVQ
jgi:hypothetical protein